MKDADAVCQYLHWALIAAHAATDRDCREVNIRVDLEHRHTTTNYVLRTTPEGDHDPKVLLDAMDVVIVALTGPEKFNRPGCIKMLKTAIAKYKGQKSDTRRQIPDDERGQS